MGTWLKPPRFPAARIGIAADLYRFSTGWVSPADTLLFLGSFPLAQIFVYIVPGEDIAYRTPADPFIPPSRITYSN